MPRKRIPVVAGWFTEDGAEEEFRLLGTRCPLCASVFFPARTASAAIRAVRAASRSRFRCRGAARSGRTPTAATGRRPYLSDPDVPWEPYTLVAVELAAERMVVLGQAAPGVGVADLAVGMTVEVVPGVLGADSGAGGNDDGTVWTTWHWRPVDTGSGGGAR